MYGLFYVLAVVLAVGGGLVTAKAATTLGSLGPINWVPLVVGVICAVFVAGFGRIIELLTDIRDSLDGANEEQAPATERLPKVR